MKMYMQLFLITHFNIMVFIIDTILLVDVNEQYIFVEHLMIQSPII